MSDKEQPKHVAGGVGSRGGGGSGGGGGDDQDDPEAKKCEGCERRGKRESLFKRRKGKKLQHQRKNLKGILVNSGCWARRCSCFKQPLTLGSSRESPASDPNGSAFTFGMLRALMEKNDFYSKECNCNPHLDADG